VAECADDRCANECAAAESDEASALWDALTACLDRACADACP
jgi:hypothetical protein